MVMESQNLQNICILMILGDFGVAKPVKNIGISIVCAAAGRPAGAGHSAKDKRWHRKGFLGKSFSPINQAGPAI